MTGGPLNRNDLEGNLLKRSTSLRDETDRLTVIKSSKGRKTVSKTARCRRAEVDNAIKRMGGEEER